MKMWIYSSMSFAMFLAPAFAGTIDTTFNAWKTNPVLIGDKLFTYTSGGSNFTNPSLVFSETAYPTQTVYALDLNFARALTNTTVDLNYTITALNPALEITGLGVDTIIGSLGTNFNLTTTYFASANHANQVAQLTSVNGSNTSVQGSFGNKLFVHVSSVVPSGNSLDAIYDAYSQSPIITNNTIVPEPSSLALFFCGGGVLLVGAHRRRNSAHAPSM